MAVANVVAKFEADISDVQAKMAALKKSFNGAADDAGRLSDRLKAVGTEMSRVGKGMTIGVTLPLAAVGAAAVKASVDFESSMNKIVGLVGIASDEVKAMQEDVLALAGQTAKSPVELADALFVVTSAGLRGETAMQALEMSAKAGAAGLGETSDIARAVAGALSAYGSDVLSAADATDQMVATARSGNFETSQFAAAIGRVLPFAQQAGASFAEMGGAVALLTRVNGDAAQSVTQIAALFRAFVVPTEEAKKGLQDVGLSAQALRDSIAKQGLPATLQMLDKALGGNREQLGRILGSSEAASAAFQILGADAQTLTDTFGVVADSAGMTEEAFGAAADTAGFKMQQAMVQLQATLIGIGDIIVPVVTEFAKFAKVLLDGFSALPGPAKSLIVAFAGIVAALGPILWIGGKVLTMFGVMAAGATTLRTKVTTAFVGMRASVTGFVTTLKTQFAIARVSWGTLAASAKVAAVGIKAAFLSMASAVKGFMVSLGPVGWAIIGVSVAYEVLSGRSAEAEARVAALTDALSQQGEAAQRAAAEVVAGALLANEWGRFMWIENNVQDFEQLADIAGVSMAEVVSAVMAGGEQLEAVIASFTEAGATGLIDPLRAAQAVQAIQAQADAYVQAGKEIQIADESVAIGAQVAGEAQRSLTSATVASAIAMGNAAGPTQEIADVTRTTEAAVRALKTAFDELNGILNQSAAQDRMTTSLQAMKDSFADAESSAMDNRDAIRGYMGDAMAFAKTLDDPRKQLKVMEGALKDVEKQMKAGEIDPKTSKLYKDMKGAVKAARDEVKEMGDAVTEAKEAGVDVADAIAQGITQGMSEQESALNAAGTLAGDTTAEGIHDALGISSPSTVAMQAGRNTALGLIQGLNQMRSAASGAGMNVGANIVRGMLTSLNNGEGPVAAAARRIVAAAIAAARAESQEGSPSRVFMGIGRNMVLGLAQGVTYNIPRAQGAATKLAKSLADAFTQALAANSGSVAGAISQVFGNIPTKSPLEELLGVKGAEKFIKNNKRALAALLELGEAIDRINEKVLYAGEAFASLGDLVARPFGRESQITEMFGSEADIDSVIDGFLSIRDQVRQAYSVLTDASIVGEKAAARNRKEMQKTIGELRKLSAQAVELRRQYDTVMQELETLEQYYQKSIAETNAFYDVAEKKAEENIKAIEDRWAAAIPGLEAALKGANEAFDKENAVLQRLIQERDQFVGQIKSGFRSFVNSLSFESSKASKQIVKETKRLANGITVTLERELEVGGGPAAIRQTLEERLAAVRDFSRNIRTLMQRGLDPSLVQDFVSAGVSGAGDAAAALAAGSQEDIAAINSVQAQLLAEADDFGAYASAQWHDIGVAQQQAIVGPLEVARDAAQKALDDANDLRDEELKTARDHLETLKDQRRDALLKIEGIYLAEKARLDGEATKLQTQMDKVAAKIEAKILAMMNTTAVKSAEAGMKAGAELLAGFRKKYPEVYDKLNRLMDQLAASLTRTATVTVKTVYDATVPVQTAGMGAGRARAAFTPDPTGVNVGTVSVPYASSAAPVSTNNVYQITVNAGVGDPREIGRVTVEAIKAYERSNGRVFASA